MTALQQHLNNLAPVNSPTEVDQGGGYDHVDLTLEETEAALQAAKKEKYLRQKREEWFEKINAQPLWVEPTALDFYKGLSQTKSALGKRYQITAQNMAVIKQLCLYFSKDARFGTDPKTGLNAASLVNRLAPDQQLDPNKGILLMGQPGTGKSHLMNFFNKNPKASYLVATTVHVAERYRTNWIYEGLNAVDYYSCLPKATVGHPFNQTQMGYCFHDLGVEGIKKNYGNEMNVMETVLFNRYEQKLPFYMTHITTNLNADQIEEFYGSRIRNRLKEMFNVFLCDWPSFR